MSICTTVRSTIIRNYNDMHINEFDYVLPQELIAQKPADKRDESRLMVLDMASGGREHRHFYDILDYLKPGDCLVMNDSKVLPARLFGRKKETGARIEFLLIKRIKGDDWETMVRPGRRVKPGDVIVFGEEEPDAGTAVPANEVREGHGADTAGPVNEMNGSHGAETAGPVMENDNTDVCAPAPVMEAEVLEYGEDGTRIVRFRYEGIFMENLERIGSMPLPPYIERASEEEDKDRYQTVYCREEGSVAAPTAGLHFTEELLQKAAEKGVRLAYVTLHVGIGTFRPVKCEQIEEHHMHFEEYEISPETAETINNTIRKGGRIISVGTTSTRTLESAAYYDEEAGTYLVRSGSESTGIFIYPGYGFKIIKALITNFHLPKSTLIMLISAFYNREKILEAYNEAVDMKYRFFSYGDAMLIK